MEVENAPLLQNSSKHEILLPAITSRIFPFVARRLHQELKQTEKRCASLRKRCCYYLLLPPRRIAIGITTLIVGIATLPVAIPFAYNDESGELNGKVIVPILGGGFTLALLGITRLTSYCSIDTLYEQEIERIELLRKWKLCLEKGAEFFQEWEQFSENPAEEQIESLLSCFNDTIAYINIHSIPLGQLTLLLLENISCLSPHAELAIEWQALKNSPVIEGQNLKIDHPLWTKWKLSPPTPFDWSLFCNFLTTREIHLETYLKEPLIRAVENIVTPQREERIEIVVS